MTVTAEPGAHGTVTDPFAFAIANRLQSGWTTQVYIHRFPQRESGLYPWIVPGGRTTLVRECEPLPTVPGVVRYEEAPQ